MSHACRYHPQCALCPATPDCTKNRKELRGTQAGGAASGHGDRHGQPGGAASLGYRDLAYYMENISVQSADAFCDVLVSRKTGDKIRLDFTRTYSAGSSTDFFADVTLQ
ncbi:MAG: hypothetical protein ABIQ47_00580 [Tepidiformaceae bacterium]